MKRITRENFRDRMILGDAVILVQALPEYWRDAHLPGALQMDYKEVSEKAHKLLPDKNAEVVCASTECQNSSIAALELQNLGYKNAYEYVEGKQDWIDGGLPVKEAKN